MFTSNEIVSGLGMSSRGIWDATTRVIARKQRDPSKTFPLFPRHKIKVR